MLINPLDFLVLFCYGFFALVWLVLVNYFIVSVIVGKTRNKQKFDFFSCINKHILKAAILFSALSKPI